MRALPLWGKVVLALVAAVPCSAVQRAETDGALFLSLQSSTLDAPLFGVDPSYSFNLHLRQRLRGGEQLTIFGSGGFPSSRPYLTLELSSIDFRGGAGTLWGGDVGLGQLRPKRFFALAGGREMPLLGIGGEWSKGERQLQLFTGTNRFAVSLPDSTELARSFIADAQWLERFGRVHLGVGTTLIVDPHYLSGDKRDFDTVVSGRYIREVRPFVHAFTDLNASAYGGFTARAGLGGEYRNGDLFASVYSFSDEMPFLYPLYRPGETGAEIGGSYRFSEFGNANGSVSYLQDDPLNRGSSFTANGQIGYSLGYERPYLSLSVSHNELVYENFENESEARFGDRIAIGASRRSLSGSYAVQLEHVEDSVLSRTQLYASWGQELRREGMFEAYALLQRDENEVYGLLTEATTESRLRGNIWAVAGIGGAYIDDVEDRAEGIATAGLAVRNPRNGWFGRIELVYPFDVGLPRANRVSRSLRARVGTRYDWADVSELRRMFAPLLFRNDYGRLEGQVTADGLPVSGAVIVVNGAPMGSSGEDGRFSISGVPLGQVRVTIDPFSVDPSLAMASASLAANIAPRETTTIDIILNRSVALFGSLVRCEGDALRAIASASIALVGDDGIYELSTTVDGGFAASDVTPGVYSIIIDPATIGDIPPDQIPVIEIDLTEDVLGYVIRLGCP